TLSWTTTNPVGTSQVTSNTPSAGTVIGNGNNSSATASVPYSSRTFFRSEERRVGKEGRSTCNCTSGTSWNGSTCQAALKQETAYDPSLSLDSRRVRCRSTLSWTTTNPVGTSQVTSNTPSAGTVIGNGNNSSATASVPYSSRTFFLYNNAVLLAQSTATSNRKSVV